VFLQFILFPFVAMILLKFELNISKIWSRRFINFAYLPIFSATMLGFFLFNTILIPLVHLKHFIVLLRKCLQKKIGFGLVLAWMIVGLLYLVYRLFHDLILLGVYLWSHEID